MPLPSKTDQIKAVMKFLDSEFMESRTLDEVAKAIVEGYHNALTASLHPAPSTPRPGMLFKTPVDDKVRRWVWSGEGKVWIVSETDSYGWIGPSDQSSFLELCEEYRPGRLKETGKLKPDGKPERKLTKLSDEEIEEEWSNPEWKPGDQVSQNHRQYRFTVVATAPRSVLLRGLDGHLTVDCNKNMDLYYKRESTW